MGFPSKRGIMTREYEENRKEMTYKDFQLLSLGDYLLEHGVPMHPLMICENL